MKATEKPVSPLTYHSDINNPVTAVMLRNNLIALAELSFPNLDYSDKWPKWQDNRVDNNTKKTLILNIEEIKNWVIMEYNLFNVITEGAACTGDFLHFKNNARTPTVFSTFHLV